jgi:penicillin-binding protein 2
VTPAVPETITPSNAAAAAAAAKKSVPAEELQIKPSWETQKLARTYAFTIPAPRGLITDRNGIPLAQTRIGYNLAIQFPTPPQFSDSEAMRYVAEQIAVAKQILRREIPYDADGALKHYKNRGIMPYVLQSIPDLQPEEVQALQRARPPGLMLQPIYLRHYPQNSTAAHVIGYVGRMGGYPTGVVENNEVMWPDFEGREGLEKTFNQQLTGKAGVMHVTFDAQGRKSNERITQPPIPGQNVVTTLDLKVQLAAEQSIITTKRPGAIVITEPFTGDILALASIPSYNLNTFIPRVSVEDFGKLRDDPAAPLVARAYYSAYPPGSTWKVITGLASMNEGFVDVNDTLEASPSMLIGNRVFNNHTRKHQGMLAFPSALMVSSNTYFYRMGLKTGAQPIIDYAARLGFGRPTGLPLSSESRGNLPTTEYMQKVHKRPFLPGDVANLSIGQGDLLVTPLQMAHAMGAVGNGGTVYQPRLVMQVQGPDQKISLGYEIRVKDQLQVDPVVMNTLRAGMVNVVQGRGGTATNAAIPGVTIAAKTGTAQWGAGKSEKVAAWFAGFAPVERPKYAFAAVYEGKEARDDVHGGSHAAPMISRVLKDFLKPVPKDKKGGLRKKQQFESDEEGEEMPEVTPEEAPRPRVVRPAQAEEEVEVQ